MYNPEVARRIYTQLQSEQDETKLFPITALVVEGILEGFVYGTHSSYPNIAGETIHLEVPAHILQLPGWSSGIQE